LKDKDMTSHREDARITELFTSGKGIRGIAADLGVDYHRIRDRIKKLNLKVTKRWHRHHDCCQGCGSTRFAHHSNGRCHNCQDDQYRSLGPDPVCGFCGADHNLLSRTAIHPHGITRCYAACVDCSRAAAKQKDILAWCGRMRHRIPDQELWATQPPPRDGDKPGAKVAILGASGFVGQNLCAYLGDHFEIIRGDCDAMSETSLYRFFRRHKPQVVINLAAFVGGIGLNRDNPGDMIHRNLVMSVNVANACYTIGVRKLIFLGTVCSYPHTPARIPFKEDDLWDGRPEPTNEPYGVAKKTVGLLLDAYKRQFNFSSAYLIPTNMYGPFDDFSLYASHVIPAMIRKFLVAKEKGDPVTLWGDGSPSRDFLYVNDCCQAIQLAIEKQDDPVPINVGSGIETSMTELAATIARLTGYNGEIVWDAAKPNGQPRRCLNIDRARQLLGFNPVTNLEDGLRSTIAWYQED
jgi:GDP-L-fucose synthase